MNINTGGPHILLFERDQQLTALVSSELQLAGYECHAARTAVEVFDAIARYPVRLVLVDLAQAAAGRREFWVALDTQRRGRGVQVFTFHCSNLAGYGPKDPEERSQTVLADMEVDGMLGIVNLMDAIRSRLPISTTTTGGFRSISSSPPSPSNSNSGAGNKTYTPTSPASDARSRPSTSGFFAAQVTAPLPSAQTIATGGTSMPLPPPAPLPRQQPQAQPPQPSPAGANPPDSPPLGFHTTADPMESARSAAETAALNKAAVQSSFTDKIRAVMYPSSRNFSPMPESTSGEVTQRASQFGAAAPPSSQNQTSGHGATMATVVAPPPIATPSVVPQIPQIPQTPIPTYGQREESGLAQLSRMLQDRDEVLVEQSLQRQEGARFPQTNANSFPSNTVSVPSAEPPLPVSQIPLRASPIEDLPLERGVNGEMIATQSARPDYRLDRTDGALRTNTAPQAVISPLASMFLPPTAAPPPRREESAGPAKKSAVPTEQSQEEPIAGAQGQGQGIRPLAARETTVTEVTELRQEEEERNDYTLVERVQATMQGRTLDGRQQHSVAADQALLLDIVQSLPAMPPMQSAPQTPVLSGRATRSLDMVLLEGHLVPQDRLEVAHNIQRMLRGVDMNYQLGEILLMFKLLTPDQLLAASLVSYGLITTVQIRALGRIRQELHSIGVEYDLENLLILFRILKPEQLREIRSSWLG